MFQSPSSLSSTDFYVFWTLLLHLRESSVLVPPVIYRLSFTGDAGLASLVGLLQHLSSKSHVRRPHFRPRCSNWKHCAQRGSAVQCIAAKFVHQLLETQQLLPAVTSSNILRSSRQAPQAKERASQTLERQNQTRHLVAFHRLLWKLRLQSDPSALNPNK